MIGKIEINGKLYTIPIGWQDVPLNTAVNLVPDGDLVWQITGIPLEIAACLPEAVQEQIAHSVTVLLENYPKPDHDVISLDNINLRQYINMAINLANPEMFVRSFKEYKQVRGVWKKRPVKVNGNKLPLYWALCNAWKEWHERWPPIPTDEKMNKAGLANIGKSFGYNALICDLADCDVTKMELVMNVSIIDIFVVRSYKAAVAAFQKRLQEL